MTHKIVLYEPQIPQNTGNIARTCSVTGSSLVLTRPLGFSTSEKALRRAGLDYWNKLNVEEIDSLIEYLEKTRKPFYFFSSKATKEYHNIPFNGDELLVFGNETIGLPDYFHQKWPEKFYRIPMKEKARCLNLANSVSIVLYEALRQKDFTDL